MQHPGFFERAGPFSLAELAAAIRAELPGGAEAATRLVNVCPLDTATAGDLTFIDNKKYLPQLSATRAGACIVSPAYAARVPRDTIPLVMARPYEGFAAALWMFYPDAGMPLVAAGPGAQHSDGRLDENRVAHSAILEDGVFVEPGAVIGGEARIGKGTRIAAGAVVGYRCTIGRNCFIGAGATVTHSIVGDRVILHAGVRIGQDGFGFAMGPGGHRKVPQIGRVIIQDDVEIGANSCVDRGALKDTVIGEGTKIDNLVQIGHNAVIGRHCVIVGQVGIAGSAELGDFVVMGGQSGVVGHIKVGSGAMIAGGSHAKDDVLPGARLVGTPAKPLKEWAREQMALKRLARKGSEEE
ncbi:MAG: hypothetical protein RLZ98_342 [Pseudomonadota bacterium]|jgi:UDP-3-O-[3-hydroxymyristoyl] glucosamine N-acyltransferase